MTSSAIDIKGVGRLVDTLHEAASSLDDMGDAAHAAGRVVASLAATTAPRRSGRLASSIAATVDRSSVEVGSDLIYAPPIHNGWVAHRIAPHPFLYVALGRTSPEVLAAYLDGVNRALGAVEGV